MKPVVALAGTAVVFARLAVTMIVVVALAFCAVLAALAVFQVALIAGAPLGRLAWGGQDLVLGIAMSALSRSRPERFTMVPVTAVLAALALSLALA